MNQILDARRTGQTAAERNRVAACMENAKTRLAASQIKTETTEPGCLLVDEAFVYWPATGLWKTPAGGHGYGMKSLVAAVKKPAPLEAARAE